MPLPAVTTIQVGALPMEGAQVVIESISVGEERPLNPNGLAFFSAQHVPELAAAAKAQDAVMVQVTCFVGDLIRWTAARAAVASAFPGAAANFVQLTRLAVEPGTSCEGVGRLQKPGSSPAKLVFTATQMAFGDQEQALRLAYGRLGSGAPNGESPLRRYAGHERLFIEPRPWPTKRRLWPPSSWAAHIPRARRKSWKDCLPWTRPWRSSWWPQALDTASRNCYFLLRFAGQTDYLNGCTPQPNSAPQESGRIWSQ